MERLIKPKPLPLEFEGKGSQKGFLFTQVKRGERAAIYRKTHSEFNVSYFEVIRLMSHNGRDIHGKYYPPAEWYPGENAFGKDAFCFLGNQEALVEKKFQKLNSNILDNE